MKNIPLSPEAIRRGVEKLRYELGRADRDRVDLFLPLFKKESRVSLAAVFEKLFPGQLKEAALTSFRQLRKRLNDTATAEGISLALETDSQKKSEPELRWCWFTGEDSAAEAVAQLIGEETAFLEHTEQDAYEVRDGKPVIRYFISYSHRDDKYKNDLCQRLEELFKIATNYYFEPWHDGLILPGDNWRDQIQMAIESCNFGLLLVSPVFLGSDFIAQNELPAFVPGNLAQPEAGKRAIPVALKPLRFDGTVDLKGLQELQIFRDSEGKAYSQRTGTKKDEFADALFAQILRVVELRVVEPAKAEYQRHSQIEHHMRREIETQMTGCNYVDGDGYSSALDKLDPKSATDKAPAQRINALNHLCAWAKDSNAPPYFALLGELGMGKTTTCLAFARELLARRTKDSGLPLPIYLDLRHLGEKSRNEPGLEEILHTVLQKNWRGGRKIDLRADEIIRLVQEQGGLAIFDGLDEVLVHLSPAAGQRFVRELLRILPPMKTQKGSHKTARKVSHGRLLLSCRTHYFRTLREQKNLLLGEGREPMGADDYRALVLLPFSHEQIISYLRQALPDQDPQRVMETIKSVHNLTEMAERPYTLSLITQQIDQIERWRMEGRTVTGVTLYRHMVQSWLERDTGKHQITSTHKQRIMEYFAAELWRSGRRTWGIEDVEQWLIDLLRNHPEIVAHYEGKDRELLKEDLRTATFLVREGEDQFRFAHTSLLEFFLACHLQRALLDGVMERWAILLASRESLDFLGQLLTEDETGREKALAGMRMLLRDCYRPQASEQALAYALLAFEKGYPAPTLAGVRMDGADLRGWRIEGRLGEKLNLRGSIWQGARLDDTFFKHLDLEHADYSAASLIRAEFLDCRAVSARFNGATLTGTLFRSANMTDTDFSGALLHRAKWLRCNLRRTLGLTNATPESFFALPETMPDNFHSTVPLLQLTDLMVFTGHSSSVTGCAYSPDGRRLVSASFDSTMRVWDAVSGECLVVLNGHGDWVNSCAYSPDGLRLASASWDNTLRIWDAESGECLATLKGHEYSVSDCVYSPNGLRLASTSGDNTLRIWDAESGECLAALKGHEDRVNGCAYSPDGLRLASVSKDKTLRVWDAESGECLAVLNGHGDLVSSCAYSPNGLRLVSASEDKTLRIWDAESGECLAVLNGHENSVLGCAYSPNGLRLVSASEDNTVRIWDAESGECLAVLKGHENRVSDCVYSPDGLRLASASMDKALRIWDAESGECLAVLKGHKDLVSDCVYSPDGLRLASASGDNTLHIWDAESGECLAVLKGHENRVSGCAYSPDGLRLTSASMDKTLRIWNVESGECLAVLRGHKSFVLDCAYSPDGLRLASASMDKTLRIWDVERGECLTVLKGHEDSVSGCAYSPDGLRLVSASEDNTVRIWDAESGECLTVLKGHNKSVFGCAYSPDGLRLVSASADTTLRVWDAESGECLAVLKGHESFVNSCAYSPDSLRLASVSWDNTLRIWDVESGECLVILESHEGSVSGCSYSPDGRRLASASADGSMRLWDLDSGTEIRQTRFFEAGAWAALDPINNRIIQVSGDAWRWLGWQGRDPRTGRMERWPAEIFGPLPEWTPTKS